MGERYGQSHRDGRISHASAAYRGKTTEEENRLRNFMRTGSPNGPGLVHWPLYDASNKYLNLDLQQSEGQDLKKDRVQFFKKLAAKKTQLQEQ
ncbi:cocaine esterase-like [Alosa sapidissima]|uniref:cocaine esterase-like n=1 Tax=Alosa sapidissima TaxID=34773 RepID=UPI001C093138|nr:cocaine esterase-like [Alosa sapidissima]